MQFSKNESNSYWIENFSQDVEKLNKQINYKEKLILSEKSSINPRIKKLIYWNNEIKDLKQIIGSRLKRIKELNKK